MRLFENKKAKLFCEQLLKYAPNNYKGCYRLAQCHVRSGEYTDAVKVLDDLLVVYEQKQQVTEAGVDNSGSGAGHGDTSVTVGDMDLSEAAVDDSEDGQAEAERNRDQEQANEQEVLEMGADRSFVLPDPDQSKPARTLTNVDYIRALRKRALYLIEQERKNKLKQQNAMKAVFASKPSSSVAASDSTKSTNNTPFESSTADNASVGSATGNVIPDHSTATSLKKKKKTPSPLEDVAIILLYISVLMGLSAIIVRFIVHYIL